MNRLLALPRRLTVPAALVSALGVVAVFYPGGLAAVCSDLHDAPALNATLTVSDQTRAQLDGELGRARNRVGYKQELIAGLVRGEVSLASVANEVGELHRADGWFLDAQRRRYGDHPPAELVARNVYESAAERLAADGGSSAVRDRLRAEFEQQFGHPVP